MSETSVKAWRVQGTTIHAIVNMEVLRTKDRDSITMRYWYLVSHWPNPCEATCAPEVIEDE